VFIRLSIYEFVGSIPTTKKKRVLANEDIIQQITNIKNILVKNERRYALGLFNSLVYLVERTLCIWDRYPDKYSGKMRE